MDSFYFILLLAFVAGTILVMYSAYNFYGSGDTASAGLSQGQDGYLAGSIESKLAAIDTSVADADQAISELSDVSSSVFKELDAKYQELLFLYNLLDEKKKEISGGLGQRSVAAESPAGVGGPAIQPNEKNIDVLISDATDAIHNSPRFKEITALAREGLESADIAKKLSMGKGEVSLILALHKGKGR